MISTFTNLNQITVKILSVVFSFIAFSPMLFSFIPKHEIQLSEFLQSEVEQIEIEPIIEFPFVPQSLIKFDQTEFHFKYIRPNLADFNPIKTIERKK